MNLSIIIVTAERVAALRKCLAALQSELQAGDEVIIATASNGDEGAALADILPGASVVRSDRRNMPYQRNVGLRAATGDIVAYIDDDTSVHPGWRAALMAPYADPGVASVVGKVVHADERRPRTGEPPGVTAFGTIRSLYHFDSPGVVDVALGQGGNMSFRRPVLESLGGFDPDYLQRSNCEETDLFERLRRAGHRIVYNPAASLLHEPAEPVGYTRSEFDRRSAFHVHRNRAYFFTKHYFLRLPFFSYLVLDSLCFAWLCTRRIAQITAHTMIVFVFATAGKVAGIIAGVRGRRRRR
jgi:GT2 family glycosyltransferase